MTGRRLYDLLCDEQANRTQYGREVSHLPTEPVAWAFLPHADRTTLNAVAARIPKARRS